VRGAIDICRLAVELARMRRTGTGDWHVGLAAAKAALSGRIRLQEGCTRTPEQVVTGLYTEVFGPPPADGQAADPAGEAMPGER
jgi:MoxR-like ATPase